METIDVYWSFRSPYSYLATPDMVELERDYDVSVRLRVVYPIAIRAPEFFDKSKEPWMRYIQRDWVRRAEFLGMPVNWPQPDPIVQDLSSYTCTWPSVEEEVRRAWRRIDRGAGRPLPMRFRTRCLVAQNGTRAIISRRLARGQGWIWRRWRRRLATAIWQKFRPIRTDCRNLVTGVCRHLCSKRSRFSGRIAWKRCAGEWIKKASRNGEFTGSNWHWQRI